MVGCSHWKSKKCSFTKWLPKCKEAKVSNNDICSVCGTKKISFQFERGQLPPTVMQPVHVGCIIGRNCNHRILSEIMEFQNGGRPSYNSGRNNNNVRSTHNRNNGNGYAQMRINVNRNSNGYLIRPEGNMRDGRRRGRGRGRGRGRSQGRRKRKK